MFEKTTSKAMEVAGICKNKKVLNYSSFIKYLTSMFVKKVTDKFKEQLFSIKSMESCEKF